MEALSHPEKFLSEKKVFLKKSIPQKKYSSKKLPKKEVTNHSS